MDKRVEADIARLHREAAELRRKAEAKEAEARGMQRAAEYMTVAPPPPEFDDHDEAKRGGRQKGALSKFWRQVLQGIYDLQRPVDVSDVLRIADVLGNEKLKDGAARARLRHYAEAGWLSGTDGHYTVTKKAVDEFELAQKQSK